MKKVFFPFIKLFELIKNGITQISLYLSRGFYFYIILFCKLINIKLKSQKIEEYQKTLRLKQEEPEYTLIIILVITSAAMLFNLTYTGNSQEVHHTLISKDDKVVLEDPSEVIGPVEPPKEESRIIETNPYKIFGKYKLSEVDIETLKQQNQDTVAWISVDGTNINYPVVQTTDNDYYLNHAYDNNLKGTGWPFMDYRNNIDMSDTNTIFYGHNLLNKTAFGSMSNIFSSEWVDSTNNTIVIITADRTLIYQVFSAYYIEPETYYLQTDFLNESQKQKFFDTISSRNTIAVDNTVNINDRIITLSTCTEDNAGRKVVHAKLISEEAR